MYESHFNLRQTPFSIAPDPAFLYLSDGHKEALAHLTYGFSHGGFVLITGEVGTGKTTLLRNLIKQTPKHLDVAFVLNPRLTVRELLETLCDELGVDYPRNAALSVKQYIDALNRHLLATHAAGRDTVVIIDEAQNLTPAVLEQIRLLTNLETDKRKLLRIILLGQPELADLLARNELRQLAQRITARYHLKGLSREDTYAYVVHRLARAGGNPHLFTRPALRRLYGISKGIPRIVNLVADRALLGAYVEGRQRVSAGLVNRAAREVLGKERHPGRWIAVGLAAATATGVASAYFLIPQGVMPGTERGTPPVSAPAPSSTVGNGVPGTEDGAGSSPPIAAGTQSDWSNDPPAQPTAGAAEAEPPPALNDPARPEAAHPPPANEVRRPDLPAHQTQRLAFQEVFSRWGANLAEWEPGVIPCNFAPSVGLQCLSRTGSWSDIRSLNLPVVLELWDQGSSPYYGAVSRIAGDDIVLRVGHERFTVMPAHLQDAWFGSYQGTLKRGDRHASVRWLRRQLESLGMSLPDDADPAMFDAALQDAVMAFQREEQILADGIVGPTTWIRLGDRLELPGPKLDG